MDADSPAWSPPSATSRARVAGWLFLVAWTVAALAPLCVRPDRYQWDLDVYLAAARDSTDGLSPYARAYPVTVIDGELSLPYLYPPAFGWIIRPLAACDRHLARALWLGLKLLAVIGLWWLWRRWIVPEVDPLLLAAVFVLGFSGALTIDLLSGNVSLFEQLLLWSGLAACVAGRPWPAALLLALAAVPKLTPAPFLLLVPGVGRDRRAWWAAAAGAALLALLLLVPDPAGGGYWSAMRTSKQVWETGRDNPCFFALTVELGRDGRLNVLGGGPQAVYLLWLAWAAVVGLLGYRLLRDAGDDARRRVLLATLVYALLVPRFKSYTYVLLVPVTAAVASRLPHRWTVGLAAVLLGGMVVGNPLAMPPAARHLLTEYHPWLAMVAVAAAAWSVAGSSGNRATHPG